MSDVTNVILAFSVMEDFTEDAEGKEVYPLMTAINAWLAGHGHGAFGPDADQISGGEKQLEALVHMGAFNYLHLEDFCAMLRTLPWNAPQDVQLLVKEQDDEKFTLLEPCVRPH